MEASYPPDGHVHTEFSYDAPGGSMEQTCARAVELGLPSIAFTEHAEFAPWFPLDPDDEVQGWRAKYLQPDGSVLPPPLDVEGYLAGVERCRDRFPELRILSGVELSEPHRNPSGTAELLDLANFDRRLGSVHTLLAPDGRELDPEQSYRRNGIDATIREYLAEVARLAASPAPFDVLAHIDFAVRYLPENSPPFDSSAFQDEFRHALKTLAGSGRTLEVNTKRLTLKPEIVRWWREEGGETLSFGSDAHRPELLAEGLREAAAMAEANGFRPGAHPYDLWIRA